MNNVKSTISIAQQDRRIKEKFPTFTRHPNHKKGIWVGELQPTKWSEKYKIKIIYSNNNTPKVTVVEPLLALAKGKKRLPHVYEEGTLCLFDPDRREWSNDQFIADTIIPWASLWLSYYEDWLYTGQWQGGGKHPNKKQTSKRNKRIKI